MHIKLQSAIALFTGSCLVSVASAPSSVGFMVTGGQAQVDGSMVRGNSTLFQGSLVQAGDVTSDLVFPGGTNLLLQPGSTARVYRDYAVLENGTATQHGSHGYVIADGLRISSPSPLGAIVVGMTDRSHLEVTAQSGTAEVRNQAGGLVARLEAGKAASFAVQDPTPHAAQTGSPSSAPPQSTSAATAAVGTQLTIHGILRKDHAGKYGHYLLTDLASNVTYELQGSELEDLVGGSVEVTGSIFDAAPAAGAAKVVSVSDIHQMALSEMSGTATAANTPPAAPPTPSGDELPANGAGPEVGATPEAKAPPEPAPEVSSEPAGVPEPPPLPIHTDTAKVLIIVGLAAGIGVGVALGLAGGKSSTVSPE